MKNFKKVLALVLVVATLLSFATVASAITSKDYKDAANIDYTNAVDVLSYIGVLNGYGDGTFKPEGEITRAEAAKIIAMFSNGSTSINTLYASANPFTDVAKGNWAESYIAYCYKTGIVGGVGNGKFAPAANVTGVQFLKMALTVLGYDAKKEGLEGASWAVNTLALAKRAGLLAGLPANFKYEANLKRQEAAQIMLNALNSNIVDYGYEVKPTTGLNTQYITTAGAVVVKDKYLYQAWGLGMENLSDAFYRPGYKWTAQAKKATTTIASYMDTPVKKYDHAVTLCDILVDVGVAKSNMSTKINYEIYENGRDVPTTGVASHANGHDVALYGGAGTQVEVYFMGYTAGVANYRIVVIDTYLAQVTAVSSYATKRDEHVGAYDVVTVQNWVWDGNAAAPYAVYTGKTVAANGFTKDQYVLINYSYRRLVNEYVDKEIDKVYNTADAGIQDIEAAKYEVATLTGFQNKTNMAKPELTYVNYEEKNDAYQFELGFDQSKTNSNVAKSLVFFYDQFGNVIGISKDLPTTAATYTVIDKIAAHNNWSRTATANVVGLDAKTTEKVNVKSFNGSTIANNVDQLGELTAQNKRFYNHLFTYSVDKDGNYTLARATTTTLVGTDCYGFETDTNDTAVKFTVKGNPNFYEDSTTKATVIADAKTQYLFHLADGSYVAFTGYANVPTTKAAYAEAIVGSDGVADIVYAYGVELPGSTALAMIFDVTAHDHHYLANKDDVYDRFTAWVGTTKTTVYIKHNDNVTPGDNILQWPAGLYTLTYTTVDGEVVAVAGGMEASGYTNPGMKAVEYVGDTSAKVADLPAFAESDVTIYLYNTQYQDVREGKLSDLAVGKNVLPLVKGGVVSTIYVDVTGE